MAAEQGESTLSYGELSERAKKLASLLVRRGVKRGEVVAVRMERSVERVIGVVGAMASGGAYLPVDPGYPEERQRYMVEDSAARVMVIEAGKRAEMEPWNGEVIEIGEEFKESSDPVLK